MHRNLEKKNEAMACSCMEHDMKQQNLIIQHVVGDIFITYINCCNDFQLVAWFGHDCFPYLVLLRIVLIPTKRVHRNWSNISVVNTIKWNLKIYQEQTSSFRLRLWINLLTSAFTWFSSNCDSLMFVVFWINVAIFISSWTISRILSLLCEGGSAILNVINNFLMVMYFHSCKIS